MNSLSIPAGTKIDKEAQKKAAVILKKTRLKMADLLRIGLDRVFSEFDRTGSIQVGNTSAK